MERTVVRKRLFVAIHAANALFLVGAAALGYAVVERGASLPTCFALAAMLVLAAMNERMADGVAVSVATAPAAALALVAGPLPAAALIMALVVAFDRRAGYSRANRLYNASLAPIVPLATWLCFTLIAHGAAWTVVLAGAAAGALSWLAQVVAIVPAFERTRRDGLHLLRTTFVWALPHEILLGVCVAGLILADAAWGVLGIALFAIPIAGMLVAVSQYSSKTAKDAQRVREMNVELRTANANLENLLSQNEALLREKERLLVEKDAQYRGVIEGLALAIDRKDKNTALHTERSSHVAGMLAVELGLDEVAIEHLHQGARLHDIGKIGVRDAVLHKPGGLTEDEWSEIRAHPTIAAEILQGLDLPDTVRHVIVHHHENVDGTGYPAGLTAEDLPIEARIMRVADSYDAMTKARSYRGAMPIHAAILELRRCAGTQFCETVVTAMERLYSAGALEDYERTVVAAD